MIRYHLTEFPDPVSLENPQYVSCDDRGFGLSRGLLPFTHARGDSCPATTEASA